MIVTKPDANMTGTAQVLYNFGAFYRQTGDLESALSYYRQSAHIFNDALGSEDPKTKKAVEAVEKLLGIIQSGQRKEGSSQMIEVQETIKVQQPSITLEDLDLLMVIGRGPSGKVRDIRLWF